MAPAPIAMPTPQRFVSAGPIPVRNFGPHRPIRGFRGPCYHCGQTGHPYRFCPTQQVSAPKPEVPTSHETDSDRVQQVSSNGELRDVYMPIHLYIRDVTLQ